VRPLLLDTCAVIWLAEGAKLARSSIELLKAADDAGQFTYISPITAWEVGQLTSRGRVQLLRHNAGSRGYSKHAECSWQKCRRKS
jgi:PIN domain nuclease of toxin-antitoxin system